MRAASFLFTFAALAVSTTAQFPQPEGEVDCSIGGAPHQLAYGDHTINCNISSPTEFDTFQFSGMAGDTVEITVFTSTFLDPFVELIDCSGSVIGSTVCSGGCSSSFTTVLPPCPLGSLFGIRVSDSGLNGTGSYTLQIERIPPATTPPPIAYDQSIDDAILPATDIDFVSFQGTAGTSVRLSLFTSTFLDPSLQVFDPAGLLIASQACSGGCGLTEDMDLTLSGTYLIALSDSGRNGTGTYELSLTCTNGDCPGVPESPYLKYNVPFNSSIDGGSPTDHDNYLFEGASGTQVQVSVFTATFLDPRLEIKDPGGVSIFDMACSGGCTVTTTPLNLTTTGTYRVTVSDSGVNGTGTYQLGLACLFGSCPCVGAAATATRNGGGANPNGYTSLGLPICGGDWLAAVDIVGPGALASIVAVSTGGAVSGIQLNGKIVGELLCLPPFISPFHTSATGMHAISIPSRCSLIGATVCTQAATFNPGAIVLNNAIDITIGTF